MKKYIQFYNYGANLELVEACGSDSVATLDGRWNFNTILEKVAKMVEGPFKRYPAYKIMKSHNGLYSQSSPETELIETKWAR